MIFWRIRPLHQVNLDSASDPPPQPRRWRRRVRRGDHGGKPKAVRFLVGTEDAKGPVGHAEVPIPLPNDRMCVEVEPPTGTHSSSHST
jgi:hypothetical protein